MNSASLILGYVALRRMEGKRVAVAALYCMFVLLSGQQQVAGVSEFCQCYRQCHPNCNCRKNYINLLDLQNRLRGVLYHHLPRCGCRSVHRLLWKDPPATRRWPVAVRVTCIMHQASRQSYIEYFVLTALQTLAWITFSVWLLCLHFAMIWQGQLMLMLLLLVSMTAPRTRAWRPVLQRAHFFSQTRKRFACHSIKKEDVQPDFGMGDARDTSDLGLRDRKHDTTLQLWHISPGKINDQHTT